MEKKYTLNSDSIYWIELIKHDDRTVSVTFKTMGIIVDSSVMSFSNAVMLYRAAKKDGFKRIK